MGNLAEMQACAPIMHEGKGERQVKICFEFVVDADGWPPVGAESVWAISLGGDRYRVDNIPFFVRGVSCGDVVQGRIGDDIIRFVRVVTSSWHSTIRVALASEVRRVKLRQELETLGCFAEYAEQFNILAIDVPPEADLKPLLAILRAGEAEEAWAYEEGNICPSRPPGRWDRWFSKLGMRRGHQ